MPTSANPQRPLADLLAELAAAVRAGDRVRATQLEQEILQRLATEAADGAGFGPGGEGFIRLNFGCPRSLLAEGLERIRAALAQAG